MEHIKSEYVAVSLERRQQWHSGQRDKWKGELLIITKLVWNRRRRSMSWIILSVNRQTISKATCTFNLFIHWLNKYKHTLIALPSLSWNEQQYGSRTNHLLMVGLCVYSFSFVPTICLFIYFAYFSRFFFDVVMFFLHPLLFSS